MVKATVSTEGSPAQHPKKLRHCHEASPLHTSATSSSYHQCVHQEPSANRAWMAKERAIRPSSSMIQHLRSDLELSGGKLARSLCGTSVPRGGLP